MKVESKSRVISAKGGPYESSLEILSSVRVKLTEKVEGKTVMIKPHVIGNDDFTTPTGVLEAIADSLDVANPSSISLIGRDLDRFRDLGYDELGFEFLDLKEDDSHIITARSTLNMEEIELGLPSRLKDPNAFIISCSPIKTHCKHIFMGSITNMLDLFTDVGGIFDGPEEEKSIRWIHENIARSMLECLPDLALIDGNNSLEGNGPLDGYHVSLGISLFSFDSVAADAVGAYLAGFNPYEIGYLYLLEKADAGIADLSKINLSGAGLEPRVFKRPRGYYKLVFSP